MIGAASDIDRRRLLAGVALGIAIVGPLAGLSAWLVDRDEPSTLGLLFLVLILVGFAVAGSATGRRTGLLPHTHGALAGLITFGVVQAVVLGVSAIVGREGRISVVALTMNGLLAASAGMIGAALASRRGHRPA